MESAFALRRGAVALLRTLWPTAAEGSGLHAHPHTATPAPTQQRSGLTPPSLQQPLAQPHSHQPPAAHGVRRLATAPCTPDHAASGPQAAPATRTTSGALVGACTCAHTAAVHTAAPVAQHAAATAKGGTATAAAADADSQPLHLVWPGFGTCFFWQAGIMEHLGERFRLGGVPMVGSSGGGLVAILGACGVSPADAVRCAFRLAREAGVYERRLGLAGVWRGLVAAWLDELLPPDAAARCAHVRLVVTELPYLQPTALGGWCCRDDLISAALASAHIPLLLDGRLAARVRGRAVVDGSLHYAWLRGSGSLVPPASAGPSLVFDPRLDPDLAARMAGKGAGACVRTLCGGGAEALVELGRRYAARLEAEGTLERSGLVARHAAHATPAAA